MDCCEWHRSVWIIWWCISRCICMRLWPASCCIISIIIMHRSQVELGNNWIRMRCLLLNVLWIMHRVGSIPMICTCVGMVLRYRLSYSIWLWRIITTIVVIGCVPLQWLWLSMKSGHCCNWRRATVRYNGSPLTTCFFRVSLCYFLKVFLVMLKIKTNSKRQSSWQTVIKHDAVCTWILKRIATLEQIFITKV